MRLSIALRAAWVHAPGQDLAAAEIADDAASGERRMATDGRQYWLLSAQAAEGCGMKDVKIVDRHYAILEDGKVVATVELNPFGGDWVTTWFSSSLDYHRTAGEALKWALR